MRHRTKLVITLLIFFSGVAAQNLMAQQRVGNDTLEVMDYEHPKEYVIADVTVSGIEFIQKEVPLLHGKDMENIIIFSVITKINRFHLLIANLGKVLFLIKR